MWIIEVLKNKIFKQKVSKKSLIELMSSIGDNKINLELFNRAYHEDNKLTLKFLMYIRDARGGLGKREYFKRIYKDLAVNETEVAKQLIPYIKVVGRYDDLLVGLKTPLEKDIIKYIKEQLDKDEQSLAKGERVSLLSKWLPSINASSKDTKRLARYLARKLKLSEKEYRQKLSRLRNGLIVENKITKKEYDFDYDIVGVKALKKYRKALKRNDKERYQDYLRVNAKERYKKELYQVIKGVYGSFGEIKKISRGEKQRIDREWGESKEDRKEVATLVVRDGSGSLHCNNNIGMLGTNSLTLYYSEQLKGRFKNKFISFSSDVKLNELTQIGVYNKLRELKCYDENDNLNISDVYKVILDEYKRGVSKEEIIERILIISDIDYELCIENSRDYQYVKKCFDQVHMKVPKVIFWNVNSEKVYFSKDNNKEIYFIKGMNKKLVDFIIEDKKLNNLEFINYITDKYTFIDQLEINQ